MAPRRTPAAPVTLPGGHEWVSFDDPDEDRTWVFDVTFLLSGWRCIYGRGCLGVLTGPAPELEQGCCSYGAHFTDDDDVARVEAAARTLGPDAWQLRGSGRRRVVKVGADGSKATRLVDGACIFLNRPGFPGGSGCALHRAALERGQRPMELKPDVCWQLPLRREDVTDDRGHVTSTVTQWDRKHWGQGGDEFHWWCTQGPEAFGGSVPVYRHMRDELVALTGPLIYGLAASYFEARATRGRDVVLPHPALKKAGP
jgi:hypothetical protein